MLGRMLYQANQSTGGTATADVPRRFEDLTESTRKSICETAELFADKICQGCAGLVEALEESLALNENVFGDADPELLSYYSEYRAVIKQAKAALAQAKGEA
jgi:hypothetical protein